MVGQMRIGMTSLKIGNRMRTRTMYINVDGGWTYEEDGSVIFTEDGYDEIRRKIDGREREAHEHGIDS